MYITCYSFVRLTQQCQLCDYSFFNGRGHTGSEDGSNTHFPSKRPADSDPGQLTCSGCQRKITLEHLSLSLQCTAKIFFSIKILRLVGSTVETFQSLKEELGPCIDIN